MPIRLILRNILAHPLRSMLTGGSVFVAVFLLCVLSATTKALTSTVENAATNRLWVQSAVSLFVDLPLSYGPKIREVESVVKELFAGCSVGSEVPGAEAQQDPQPHAYCPLQSAGSTATGSPPGRRRRKRTGWGATSGRKVARPEF